MAARRSSFVSNLLRRRYWALALALTLAVWLGVALAMRPLREEGGGYERNPYGLTTSLENRGLKEPITIIEIDERAIRASNVRLQKWPRDWYARLIDRAREGGAKVVGLDVYLSEEGGTSVEDKAADQTLADAIYNTDNVVLAQKLEAGGIPAIIPLPEFSDGATAVGFVDLPHDSDSFVRTTQLVLGTQKEGEQAQFSFAAALAQLYSGDELKADTDYSFKFGDRMLPLRTDETMQLDFRG